MTFTADEMLEVAKRVYPDRKWILWKAGAVESQGYYSHATGVPDVWVPSIQFSPSLTGTDREGKQALDCIAAAFHTLANSNNPAEWGRFIYDPGWLHACLFEINKDEDEVQADDILSASISAILSHIGVKHER